MKFQQQMAIAVTYLEHDF